MGFGAGQIVYEDDLAEFIARETYQEITTVSVVASTTMVDIPGSQFNVVAGATYWVDVWIAYDGPTAADARFCWTTSDADISLDRNIQAPAKTITSNEDTNFVSIRRGTNTQEQVGTPGASVSAYTVYHEVSICKSIAAADGTAKMQFAQAAASGTSLVQSGYMKITRVA